MEQAPQIKLSLNEIEQLCLKAARGAGFGWGLAEEAGAAAAWLVQHGMDGPDLLLRRLLMGPLAGPMLPWSSQHRLQCPISLGAALCDHVDLAQTNLQDGAIELGCVAIPELLFPFLGRIAQRKKHAIAFNDIGYKVVLSDEGHIAFAAAQRHLDARSSARISKAVAAGPTGTVTGICATSALTINALGIFAMRTTVPASEVSRAGAGASDRDID